MTTVTGAQVRDAMLRMFTIPGIHYGADDCPHRCQPDLAPHCADCSGSTSWVLNQLGLNEGCTGSFQQAQEAHSAGPGMSTDEALNTPGAFLFQGINEGQGGIPGKDHGHVGVSAGDGIHTLEARGHWAGVGVFYGRSLVWQWCGMMPGVTHGEAPMPPNQPAPLPSIVVQEDPMSMIALPRTNATPDGKVGTARPVRGFNFVLLENGARLVGDVPVDTTGADRTRHWWAPDDLHTEPGIQLVDIADLRVSGDGQPAENAILATYAKPNGAIQTFKAAIAVPA